MSLVVDEQAVLGFVEALKKQRRPEDPDEYYIQILTREKYGGPDTRILVRKVVPLDGLLDAIHDSTPFRGFYVDGKRIPHESLACYVTPEPRDTERAMKQLCAQFILKDENQTIRMPAAFYSECQKYPAQRRILDVDIDNTEKYPDVAEKLKEIGVNPTISIKSRGGYHLLCYDCTPIENKALYDMSKAIGDIDLLKNALVPIPGTLQGGIPVMLL